MRSLPSIGRLVQDARIPEWWLSQPIAIPCLSGQRIPFTLMLEADGDQYPSDVNEAVASFLSLTKSDLDVASAKMFKNYRDFADVVEIDVEIACPADVWKHVSFKELYVDRRLRLDQDVYITLACECDWEPEHGLQLVYRRGSKLVRISEQDGHLTHADAYDLPNDEDV